MTGTMVGKTTSVASSDGGGSQHPLPGVLGTGRTTVCGILNVTPDSFSDGGLFDGLERAVEHGCRLAADGADLIDIGGESTRPGSRPPTLAEELARVIPVVEALVRRVPVPLSVDTSRPDVMRAAVAAGASMINDVRALRLPGALEAAADAGVPVCLMHMQARRRPCSGVRTTGTSSPRCAPSSPSGSMPASTPVSGRTTCWWTRGIGFGKTLSHNLALLASLGRLSSLGVPIMVGLSRKAMLGQLTGRP